MQETDSKHPQDTVSRDEPGQTTDYKHDSEPDNSSHESANLVRPPIVYTSLREFLHSFIKRFKSLWTRSFILSLLAGQVVSLCITCTSVTTTELVGRNWILPTTQTFFLYASVSPWPWIALSSWADTCRYSSFTHHIPCTSVCEHSSPLTL
jgi:hypothetical protein